RLRPAQRDERVDVVRDGLRRHVGQETHVADLVGRVEAEIMREPAGETAAGGDVRHEDAAEAAVDRAPGDGRGESLRRAQTVRGELLQMMRDEERWAPTRRRAPAAV